MKQLISVFMRLLRTGFLRDRRRSAFAKSNAEPFGGSTTDPAPMSILIVGVYLSGRSNSAALLARNFRVDSKFLNVTQRWISINGISTDPLLAADTILNSLELRPKFELINQVLKDVDIQSYEYILISDDDIIIPKNFLYSFLSYQKAFGLALAQPARTWNSHFDHGFVLRRPWLLVRETRFVECGPLISLARDAATVLLPFANAENLWGLDFVWPYILEANNLKMGIVDAIAVDHSLRPQAEAYNKATQDTAMHDFLKKTAHIEIDQAFTVTRSHKKPARNFIKVI